MKKLYLIRGMSGAGKSTLAREMCLAFRLGGYETYEVAADDYYIKDGIYEFDANKLGEAHLWCQGYVMCAMRYDEADVIIVHNTFTTEKEMQPYFDLATEYGYDVTTMVVENRHGNCSVHDVPEDTLKRQRNRLRNSIQF